MPVLNQSRGRAAAQAALCAVWLLGAAVAVAGDNPKLGVPEGFGANTMGAGARPTQIVAVSTREQLKNALCNKEGGNGCEDDTPRLIQIKGIIDFVGSQGEKYGRGCLYPDEKTVCRLPMKNERLLAPNDGVLNSYCAGKRHIDVRHDLAGIAPLLVGSNKTIIGIGANAGIRGKGLRLLNSSNVIIRNLTFSDLNEGIIFAGDAITLENVDRVWIDHNRFERIGRHFLTGGFSPVRNVTVSWNDFNGASVYSSDCGGKHYWNMSMGGRTQQITFANNWFRNFTGRAPLLGSSYSSYPSDGLVHMVNNYFQSGGGHAIDVFAPTKVLVEGNYFDNVNTPITPGSTQAHVFGTAGGADKPTQAKCKDVAHGIGRNCFGNQVKSGGDLRGFELDSAALEAFGKARGSSPIVTPYQSSDVPKVVQAGAGPGKI